MKSSYHVVPLHHRFDLIDACCELLNTEWKKSYGIRSRILSQSKDELPCNLIMLDDAENVIGHVRMSGVVGEPQSSFLTSVIICPERRGEGLGRRLLQETEEYALKHGFTSLYLTSDEKEDFYKKCGYVDSHPVEQFFHRSLQDKILQLQSRTKDTKESDVSSSASTFESKNCARTIEQAANIPPPPPVMSSVMAPDAPMTKIWLKKILL